MSIAHQKYKRLVEGLYNKSLNKAISWSYHSVDKYVETIIANRAIRSWVGEDEEGNPLAIIVIINEDGNLLERFNDEDIKGNPIEFYDGKTYYQLMISIIDMAKRQATGADDAIDAILEELEDTIPF